MKNLSKDAAKLYRALLSTGVEDRNNFRFAVHEVCHAFQADIEGPFGIDEIHDGLVDSVTHDTEMWLLEIRARAVERKVCQAMGVKIKPLEHWIRISCMEAIKGHTPYADFAMSVTIADGMLMDAETTDLVDQILALALVEVTDD